MSKNSGASARVERLHALYSEQFHVSFDTAEFLSDDFYAFQVIERSIQVGASNRELHNLAMLMHAERKALMEVRQRRALDVRRNISHPGTPVQAARKIPAAGRAAVSDSSATVPRMVSLALAGVMGKAPVAWPLTGMPLSERRSGKVRLSAQEIMLLSGLHRVYHRHFDESFEVEEFARNDLYVKVVLAEVMSSGQQDMIALATPFLDKSGRPRLHRRRGRVDVELEHRAHQ